MSIFKDLCGRFELVDNYVLHCGLINAPIEPYLLSGMSATTARCSDRLDLTDYGSRPRVACTSSYAERLASCFGYIPFIFL